MKAKPKKGFDFPEKDLQSNIHVTNETIRLRTQAFLNRNPTICRLFLLIYKLGPSPIKQVAEASSKLLKQPQQQQTIRYQIKQLTQYDLVSMTRYSELFNFLSREQLIQAEEKYKAKLEEYPLPFRHNAENEKIAFCWVSATGDDYIKFVYYQVLKLKKEVKK